MLWEAIAMVVAEVNAMIALTDQEHAALTSLMLFASTGTGVRELLSRSSDLRPEVTELVIQSARALGWLDEKP